MRAHRREPFVALTIVCASAIGTSLGACGSEPRTIGPIDAAIDAPPDALPCGTRSGARGMSRRQFTIDGLVRSYIVYLPPGRDAQTALPLVVVYHGFTMSGARMFDLTEYPALADREGIALAFPDGQAGPDSSGAPWNVGRARDLCPSYFGAPPVAQGDDFAFFDAMRADISEDQCVDLDHVYVTGFSMGGYFAHHAACMREDIRAVAPHSGGTHALDECKTARRPIVIVHGRSDEVIPAGCSDPGAPMAGDHVASATLWAQRNGCSLSSRTVPVRGGRCFVYDDCPVGGQVQLCTFDNMGHCWAGGPVSEGIYACPEYAAATQIQWDFFKTHAW